MLGEPIWAVLLNVRAFRDGGPPGGEAGFVNVVSAAATPQDAERNAREAMASCGWTIYSLESVWEVDPDSLYHDAHFNEIVEDVIANPHHVRLSTLHTYRVD